MAWRSLLGDDLTVSERDWRVSSGEERWMEAAGASLRPAVPRRGRVDEAVGAAGAALGGGLGGARVRRRGMASVEG